MSNLTWTKNYDELGFNDDFMFGITMQDSEDHINRGSPFSTLPDSKILFICTFDPFGLGKA